MGVDKTLHVLVIATWYPQDRDKLIGIYHKQYCEALANVGVKVNMLHIDRQAITTLPSYLLKKKRYEIKENGYTTYFRRMINRRRISNHMQLKAYTRCLRKLYREYEAIHGKPDILHAQVTVPAGYAACRLGEEIGVPVIITEHATYFERFFNSWCTSYAIEASQKAAMVTCVGQYMKTIYMDRYGIKAEILPNIVDCAVFGGPKKPHNDGKLHIISVCALREGKNIDHAVAALRILRDEKRIPDFEYTVVGDGYLRDTYWSAVEDNKMTDCVRFVGQKNREEIAQFLAQSDMLIMPTYIETFGIPAVEAAAAGVPVVCTRCGGPEGFLNADSAEFCTPCDVPSIADAIERMVHRLPNMDEAAIRNVAKQFDAAAVADLAISYYREIV